MEMTLDGRLADTGTQDPRPAYRELLRLLKERDPAQFDALRQHYAREVEGALTEGGRDPLTLWLDYGLVLAAALGGEGTAMAVDQEGLASPIAGSPEPGSLTLWIPEGRAGRAIAVTTPATPSPAQVATLDLLVHGKVRLQPTNEAASTSGL